MAIILAKAICIFIVLILILLIVCGLSYLYEEDYKRHPVKLFIIAVLFIQIHITFGYVLGSFCNIKALSLLPLAFGIAIICKSMKTGRIQELMQVLLIFIGVFSFLFLFMFLFDNFTSGGLYLSELPQGILKQWKYFFNALTSLL